MVIRHLFTSEVRSGGAWGSAHREPACGSCGAGAAQRRREAGSSSCQGPPGTAHTLICICAPKDNCSTSRVNDKATPKTLGLVFPWRTSHLDTEGGSFLVPPQTAVSQSSLSPHFKSVFQLWSKQMLKMENSRNRYFLSFTIVHHTRLCETLPIAVGLWNISLAR